MIEKIRFIRKEEEKDIFHKVCSDILRALTILYGSAWQSDLESVLLTLWQLRNIELDKIPEFEKNIEKAIKYLNEEGIIKSQERMKGDLSGKPVKEVFHTILNISFLLIVYGGDKEVLNYRKQ
jgi:hypothetical protein